MLSDEVLLATMAPGEVATTGARTEASSSRFLRQRLDHQLEATAGLGADAHLGAELCGLLRRDDPQPAGKRECVPDTTETRSSSRRDERHLVPAEQVLAADLRAHQARTEDDDPHRGQATSSPSVFVLALSLRGGRSASRGTLVGPPPARRTRSRRATRARSATGASTR